MDSRREAHFPLFDSLRAIAALTVFTIHDIYQVAVNRPEDHYWYRFGVHLDVAVPIFFAVSGFLLYRPFLAASLAGRPLSVRAYAWRRALRIVPAYWIALAAIAIWFDLHEVKSLGAALRTVLGLIAFSVVWKLFALTQTDAAVQASAVWLYPLPSQLDHLGAGML